MAEPDLKRLLNGMAAKNSNLDTTISFLGAGTHLLQKQAVSPDPIPASEWRGLR